MTIYLCTDGNADVEIDANSAEDAAQDYVDGGDFIADKTTWVTVYVVPVDEDDNDDARESYTITVDPPEPKCDGEHEHDWRSPYHVVGGIEDNPGVWGHGGGVIMRLVCAHCGRYKIVDTWAQNPENGQQGLDSVAYEEPDEESTAWVESK